MVVQTSKKGYDFLDIGANAGYFTILGSKLVGKNGMTIAFEPVTSNFEMIKANLQLNDIKNPKIFNQVIANKNDKIYFFS